MKRFHGGILMVALAAIGCGNGDGTAGGPGNTTSKPVSMGGRSNDTFTLITSSVGVKQADVVATMVGIKRGTNFAQDVTVTFADLPKGVTAKPASPVIKSSTTEVKFDLVMSEDVVPGEYIVNVIGHPATGSDATNQFTLTVGKKDTFTLNIPAGTTTLKQGEAKAVTIAMTRDKSFDQAVTLKIDGLPKGVTLDPAGAVIASGANEVRLTLNADAEAALGDFAATITGSPAKGAVASQVFKFSITRK